MKFPPATIIHEWRPACWLSITGEDAANFLQGQFSNELRGLPEGGAAYGLWLTLKGKVLADSFVVRGGSAGGAAAKGTRAGAAARPVSSAAQKAGRPRLGGRRRLPAAASATRWQRARAGAAAGALDSHRVDDVRLRGRDALAPRVALEHLRDLVGGHEGRARVDAHAVVCCVGAGLGVRQWGGGASESPGAFPSPPAPAGGGLGDLLGRADGGC